MKPLPPPPLVLTAAAVPAAAAPLLDGPAPDAKMCRQGSKWPISNCVKIVPLSAADGT